MVIDNVSSKATKQMSLKSELFPYVQNLDLYAGNAYWHRNAFVGSFTGKITGSASNKTGRSHECTLRCKFALVGRKAKCSNVQMLSVISRQDAFSVNLDVCNVNFYF